MGKIVLEYLPEWGCTCRWDGEYIGVRSATKIADERVLLIDSDGVPPKILDYEGKGLKRWDYVINALTQVSGIDGGKRIVLASRKDHRF